MQLYGYVYPSPWVTSALSLPHDPDEIPLSIVHPQGLPTSRISFNDRQRKNVFVRRSGRNREVCECSYILLTWLMVVIEQIPGAAGHRYGANIFWIWDMTSTHLCCILYRWGALESKNPIYSNDRFIGRILSKSIAPPLTAASLKKHLCRVEGFDDAPRVLFEEIMVQDCLNWTGWFCRC